jgi:HEPN domain-containing protein
LAREDRGMNDAAESFIALAREDLAVANRVLKDYPRASAFHLQQAAEKLLKAVLSAEGIAATAKHQLGDLAGQLPDDHIWRADLMAFDEYTPYATSLRYPKPGGGMPRTPPVDKLEKSLKEVASLVDEIRDWCEERNTQSKPSRR